MFSLRQMMPQAETSLVRRPMFLGGFDVLVMGAGAILGLALFEPDWQVPEPTRCAAVLAGALAGVWIFGHSGRRYRLQSKADLLNTCLIAMIMGLFFALSDWLYDTPLYPLGAAVGGAIVALFGALAALLCKTALLTATGRPVAQGEWPKLLNPRGFRANIAITGKVTYQLEPAEELHADGPHAVVLSLTPVTDEPRVRRQCTALWRAGWNVTVIGYPSRSPKPRYWQLLLLLRDYARNDIAPLLETVGPRRLYVRFLRLLVRINRLGLSALHALSTRYAGSYYWRLTWYPAVYGCLARAREAGIVQRCDLVIAHDWFTAPVAWRFARDLGAAMTVDCHEYSTGQYMHRPDWVKHERPFVHAIEQSYLPRADAVTTVCDGIAGLLGSQYQLREPPVVIRSVAPYQDVPIHESKEPMEIVYSGLIDPIRGLEELIHGVSLADDKFRVVLRGPVTTGFDEHLMTLAAHLGIDERVRIEPPAPFSEIVSACSRSDIGYFVHEDISPQKRFVLPNKFFEYIMAGLALCVSDLPEMARILRHYDLGTLVAGSDPSQIADALNRLDVEQVKRFRRNTRAAAAELNWERESIKMVELYGRIAARSASQESFRRPEHSATRDG